MTTQGYYECRGCGDEVARICNDCRRPRRSHVISGERNADGGERYLCDACMASALGATRDDVRANHVRTPLEV